MASITDKNVEANVSDSEKTEEASIEHTNDQIAEVEGDKYENTSEQITPREDDRSNNELKNDENKETSNLSAPSQFISNDQPTATEVSEATPSVKQPNLQLMGSNNPNRSKSDSSMQIEDEIMKKAKVYCFSRGKLVYVSYWDLGGDELYYATHHIHLSSDAVYVLVFDMTHMTEEAERRAQMGECSSFKLMLYFYIHFYMYWNKAMCKSSNTCLTYVH